LKPRSSGEAASTNEAVQLVVARITSCGHPEEAGTPRSHSPASPIPKIKQGSLKIRGTQVQIQTVNTPKVIRESVQKLARLFGTETEAEKNIEGIERFYAEWRKEVGESGLGGASVVCHAFLAPIAQELGLNVVGTYGPAPLEAVKIAELAGKKPRFILDNWHTDAGKPLIRALPETPVVSFINFPGKDGTKSLLDVLTYNREQLRKIGR